MPQTEESTKGAASENFVQMFEAFGRAISEIFNDPNLKEKAKELGRSVVESGETLGRRFQDEDVKAKFTDVGKAAQEFGKSLVDYFKPEKEIGHTDKEDQ
jgi:hypothetical protein